MIRGASGDECGNLGLGQEYNRPAEAGVLKKPRGSDFLIPIITATRRATKGLKKIFETVPGKHLTDTLNKTATCTRNITHNTEILQSETEESPFVQEKCQGEKACDKRHNNNNNNNNNNALNTCYHQRNITMQPNESK
jgi:hypothetical protein